MACKRPRKLAKCEKEERIQATLLKRGDEGGLWAMLVLDFGIAEPILNHGQRSSRRLSLMAENPLERL